jgi:hypothetical protein
MDDSDDKNIQDNTGKFINSGVWRANPLPCHWLSASKGGIPESLPTKHKLYRFLLSCTGVRRIGLLSGEEYYV